ncbi:uncharacterized protein LOC112603150 [Melanaphis sacchari]|uniref:uncharacterized protein LOC112603150 n=1 Tax=Melanaphis sacchari TaxID=742174 RepID=UPI000DC14D4E|nr:uncharacterized protein LOC112603150 [Melanaphis sacchari]XP_025207376.1 uncharacterized protein LOC112603150 [Melanaphis sacchari]XP_025207377.1 uncharacterized protein LOC112603150 [Melanaphis sacchari]XP_025207379.1 uncharacterized protein LOC112603150 [Melanaphis sacchari]
MAMTGDRNCSCTVTAPDDSCKCADRSIVQVLDLATPTQFEVVIRQPSSKRSRRAYKSMTAAGKTDAAVVHAAARKRLIVTSTEALHRPSPVECNRPAPTRKQRPSHSEVVEAADRNSCNSATDGLQAPNPLKLQATDQRVFDFCAAELQVTDELQESGFYSSGVIVSYASDEFDAVDLTVNDYRQSSVDTDGWDVHGSGVEWARARSLENRMRIGDVRKENGSSWARFKKFISRRLCCQQRI